LTQPTYLFITEKQYLFMNSIVPHSYSKSY